MLLARDTKCSLLQFLSLHGHKNFTVLKGNVKTFINKTDQLTIMM